MSEWKEVAFERLFEIPLRNGLNKPSRIRGAGTPMVNMKEIFSFDFIHDDTPMELVPVTRSEEDALLRTNDLLFARQSLVESGAGKISIFRGDRATVFESHLIRCRIDETVASPLFLYYFFKSPIGRGRMSTIVYQTAAAGIRGSDLKDLDVSVPSLAEQHAIASVLGSLDAKIDLLHRQNKTLEGMAEALFREWFVVEAREDWEESDVYSVLNVTYGFPFKSKFFNEEGRGLPLIRIRDLSNGTSNVYTDEACDEKYVLQCGDLVAGMDGEFRLYIWSGSKAVLNQRACKFSPAHEYVPYMYVLNLMRPHLHYYENTKVGTTVIHLGKSDIDEIRVAVPPKELLLKYGRITEPMHKKIINNHTQIRTLIAQRDTLLPKLMSGEVRVGQTQEVD